MATKVATSVRFSLLTMRILDEIKEKLGLSHTTAMELALRQFAIREKIDIQALKQQIELEQAHEQ